MGIRLCAIALTLALCAACTSDKQPPVSQQDRKDAETSRQLDEALKAHNEWKKQHATDLNERLPPRVQTTSAGQNNVAKSIDYVRIGVNRTQVIELCGRPDNSDLTQTARGSEFTYWYDIKNERAGKGCWGMLMFDKDDKLVLTHN